jgi:uncharacterized protein
MTAPIVTVRGEAQLEGPPDVAGLSCTLHASGDSAEATRAQLATGSQAVAALLERFADALERRSTSGLHVSPTFNHKNPTKITGYTGTFTTSVVVADFEALSALVLALSALPSSQVDGPWWSLRPDNPMYREVRLAAIAEARRRAEDYAAAFGATVSELVEVSDLDGGMSMPMGRGKFFGAMEMAGDSSSSFSFEPALQTVTGNVTVRFTLAPA